MFPCEQSLNLFEYYDVLAGDIQSLPLNNTLESENTNTLAHFFFHFWVVFKYLLDFLESSFENTLYSYIGSYSGIFGHFSFLCLPNLLVYSLLAITEVVLKIILFALAWPCLEIVCKKAWENKTWLWAPLSVKSS